MKQFSFLLFFIVVTLSQANIALAKVNNSSKTKQGNQQSNLQVNSAQQAAQMVKGRYGGKVLKVSSFRSQGHTNYRVKLVKNDGHVISVVVNAKTGQLKGK
jgi:uncharacterized membrane protein YkoI